MKKLALSAVLMATSGLASAQSSVTLFGVVDVALQHGSGSTASRTLLGSGANLSSRLGFRGVEDLGGGMSASFWLEAALLPDNGSGGTTSTNNQASGTAGGGGLTFGRRSTVSLAGRWGEVRLGRDYAVQYYNRFTFDPFSNVGAGGSQTTTSSVGGPVSSRVSNAIMYFLPGGIGGFYGLGQYYLGENLSNSGTTSDDGEGGGIRVGYRTGALNVAVAHARTQYAQTATTGDITATNFGARYDMGAFSLMGGYYRDRVETIAGLTGRGAQVGGIYRVGAGEIKAQWSQYKTNAAGNPETKKLSLGYVHNLSKRTAVYATYARLRNSGGATRALNGSTTAANQSSSGIDLGLRHRF